MAAVCSLIGFGPGPDRLRKGAAKGAADAATAAIPVQVEIPSRGEMLSVYAGTAPLQADQEAAVVAKVAGEVREILFEEGDRVQAGQVLARLDGDRLRFEVQQSEANLRKLEREYKRTWSYSSRKLVASVSVENVRYEMEVAEGGLRPGAAESRLHGDPRAYRRRRLQAPHQGRQHDQRERPHVRDH